VDESKELNISKNELVFYDLLASKEKFFENYLKIKTVAKQIVKELD